MQGVVPLNFHMKTPLARGERDVHMSSLPLWLGLLSSFFRMPLKVILIKRDFGEFSANTRVILNGCIWDTLPQT